MPGLPGLHWVRCLGSSPGSLEAAPALPVDPVSSLCKTQEKGGGTSPGHGLAHFFRGRLDQVQALHRAVVDDSLIQNIPWP